jgi:hypothetical protein
MKVILAWIFAALIASAVASPASAEPVRRAVPAKVYDFLRDGPHGGPAGRGVAGPCNLCQAGLSSALGARFGRRGRGWVRVQG